MRKNGLWRWVILAVVVLGGLALRAHDISRIFLWFDETDMFNEYVYGSHHMSLIEFVRFTRNATTVAWGWPGVVWVVSRALGSTVEAARLPTVLMSAAGVLALFFLVYTLLPRERPGERYWPALFAALFAAVSIVQLEYAQRTYPYGAAPCMAALILLAHFEIRRSAGAEWKYSPRLLRAVALYAAVVSVAFCIHSSLALLPAVSVAFLAFEAAPHLLRQSWAERWKVLRPALVAGAILAAVALGSGKNPKYGFRAYLSDYYESPSLHAIPTLALHAYGLLTYQLNLFYNPSLYWPERLDALLLPLVLLCLWGWGLAAAGKYGPNVKHLAWLGVAAAAAPAVLSVLKIFPFGGVRQCLFLDPFLLAFTALGFYSLRSRLATRALGIGLVCAYLAVWVVNLPAFYARREPVYTPANLLQIWQQNGKLPLYSRGSPREMRYELRRHPELTVVDLPPGANPRPPYLLVETHNWIGDHRWFEGFTKHLNDQGNTVMLLNEVPPWHPESTLYPQSLYFPPNGFWVYKVIAQ